MSRVTVRVLSDFDGPRIRDGVAAAIREHGDAARGAVVSRDVDGWRGWAIVGDPADELPTGDCLWDRYRCPITMGRTDEDHARVEALRMPHPAKRSYEASIARDAAVLAGSSAA